MESHQTSKTQIFIFDDSNGEATRLEGEYISGSMRVEPVQLFTAMTTLMAWVDARRQITKGR
jgi:hypothetical protein